MKIDINKKYRTRKGQDVVIYKDWSNDEKFKKTDFPIHGAIKLDENTLCTSRWTIEGYYGTNNEINYDLIEVSGYEDFKIDDPVYAYDYPGLKMKRHFAGIDKNGKPETWTEGRTSWTTTDKISWNRIEKADNNAEDSKIEGNANI